MTFQQPYHDWWQRSDKWVILDEHNLYCGCEDTQQAAEDALRQYLVDFPDQGPLKLRAPISWKRETQDASS